MLIDAIQVNLLVLGLLMVFTLSKSNVSTMQVSSHETPTCLPEPCTKAYKTAETIRTNYAVPPSAIRPFTRVAKAYARLLRSSYNKLPRNKYVKPACVPWKTVCKVCRFCCSGKQDR